MVKDKIQFQKWMSLEQLDRVMHIVTYMEII